MKKVIVLLAGVFLVMNSFLYAADKPEKAVKSKVKTEKAEPDEKAEEGAKSLKTGDRMQVIKFDKGELLADGKTNKFFETSLSKEKAEKGTMYSCKAILKKGGKGFPIIEGIKGKRGDWKDYDTLVVKYFLEGDKPMSSGMIIADQESYGEKWENWKYSSYCSKRYTFLPGENTWNIDLTALVTNGGRNLDLANMRTVAAYSSDGREEDYTIYFQAIYVEKE
ncbi:MAG: hypothetical protein A2231_01490 [Candidatus Firestonebacteria bacterium RIFOXYA2_FULL_40_8]|nr:MAG: hypothetical protein A2231_01490 [Candidatus Firestonebacteria bacterium RIFOXYA2_FULL_40_8]